jgi:hypothetical protein
MEKTAQCLCGKFRVIVTGEPRSVAVCHCGACQRRTGVPLACNAFYARSDVRLEGSYRVYLREGQEGRKIRQHFCPDCGTTVYSAGEKFPGMCVVPVGAFADPGFQAPTVSVFEESKHPWVTLPPGIERHVQGRAPNSLRAEA